MSVSLGNNFGARTILRANTAGGPVRWANTWEFDATGLTGGLLVDAPALVDALVTLHRGLIRSNFFVESVTISTAADDGKPYNPDTFYTRTVMLRGLHGSDLTEQDVQVLPLTNCLLVKKLVSGGREGNLLLRGYLTEADIQSDPLTGAVTLTTEATMATQLSASWDAFSTAAIAAGATPSMYKAVAGSVSQVRTIDGLHVKGHTVKKLNNKYFDKGAGTLGGVFNGLVEQYGPTVIGQVVNYLIGSGGTPPLLP